MIGGFTSSFLVFLLVALQQTVQPMRGELVGGANQPIPTILDTTPIASIMNSYSFWLYVLIGGMLVSFIIFKLMDRLFDIELASVIKESKIHNA